MISTIQAQFPNSNTPLVQPTGTMTPTFMSFLRALYNRTGEGTGIPTSVTPTTSATGTAIGTAQKLGSDWNNVTAGDASNNGVQLSALTGGQNQVVFNNSGVGIIVYPPNGATIDAAASYNLANAKMQIYWFMSSTQVLSTQLG